MLMPLHLLTIHFFADFVFQSNWMALGKSKKLLPLLAHVAVYSVCFLPFGWKFAGITSLLHFCTDFLTSRLSSVLWFIDLKPRRGSDLNAYPAYPFYAFVDMHKRQLFWWVIGFDQLIHAWCLLIVYSRLHV